jgi:predicted DNA-binding ArsR family transcriptional regulator
MESPIKPEKEFEIKSSDVNRNLEVRFSELKNLIGELKKTVSEQQNEISELKKE